MTTRQPAQIRELYYITHISNVPSILRHGIFSHERIESEHITFTPIYDAQIVNRRKDRAVPDGRSLWTFANLYFQPRNPMMYRVALEKSTEELAVLGVAPTILNYPDLYISKGNAASPQSEILAPIPARRQLASIKKATEKDWWKVEDNSKREIMAECLIPEVIRPEHIRTVYVADHNTAEQLKRLIGPSDVQIVPEPYMFFRPRQKIPVTNQLYVVEGDMFFSRMHTLTVSVNTVGIMGRGLASRAKYQFPDVYVTYQDMCRKRVLRMGKPYVYKRGSSLDFELADEPAELTEANKETWFLLFATKRHWRDRGDKQGIEEGLQWVCDNYKKEGIKSLAVPALGCGLGGLTWNEMGPVICGYLSLLDIPVEVYLPTESPISREYLSREYLLQRRGS